MINISGLHFEYPNSNFSFDIPELTIESGGKIAIIGPSGYGKTTFLNLLSGISVPNAGSINIQNIRISSLSDPARRSFRISNIGFVFQNFELIEYLNVLDNILLSYRINPSLKLSAQVIKRAADISDIMGLGDKKNRNVNKLSQGEMQRVAICRALLTEPKFLLADEPTGNLDPDNKELIMNILFDYAEQNKATLITVTHDHSLLGGFDKVLNLKDLGN